MHRPCVDMHSADWHRLQQSAAFWDVNPTTLDPQRHAAWIIARILQFGTWDEWLALFRCYPAATIQHALTQRGVPDHIRRFWTPYFSPDDSFTGAEPFPSLTNPTPHSLLKQAVQTCDMITHRGTRQDFLDLYALVLDGVSLTDIFDAVVVSTPSCNLANLLRRLWYFVEVEQDLGAGPSIHQAIKQPISAYLRRTLPSGQKPRNI
ncbi:DUF6922 domain-containing protein [Sulfobacillus thermosulfidooxidans]|nr:hypothetical protein [Sulfobacillus thermosulfidooxidans]